MEYTALADLDELVLRVRDRLSASYIQEALNAYRGRAYRSAVISTWIAVAYDIISKLRELATGGEPSAQTFISELDNAIANRDIKKLQSIENSLLERARRDFELLSDREEQDMARLFEDRNHCAHPAFVDETKLFVPEPELVRLHIVHAIQHLLRHQPVQGKSALARVKVDLLRSSFPTTQEGVEQFLRAKYLDRAKGSLIEALVSVFLKVLLKQVDPDLVGRETAVIQALMAIAATHVEIYEAKVREQVPKLANDLDDSELERLFPLIHAEPRIWSWLTEPTRLQVRNMVEHYSAEDAIRLGLFQVGVIGELREKVLQRFSQFSREHKLTLISQHPLPEFTPTAVELYQAAGSYRGAETLGRAVLLPLADYYSRSEVAEVLSAVRSNNQIHYAGDTPSILATFFDRTSRHHAKLRNEWRELMRFLHKLGDGPASYFSYPLLRKKMEAAGLWDPSTDEQWPTPEADEE